MIQKKCNGEDYIPIDALEILLKYAPKNDNELGEEISEEDTEQHCYFFETAWLIVIKDIEKRIDLMKNINVAELLQHPEVKTHLESTVKRQFDIKELFKKIIDVGKEKWDSNKDKESLAYAILTNMEKLMDSKGFDNFSKRTLDYSINPENISIPKTEDTITQEIQEYALDQIKSLFKMTYAIMNDEKDLTNMEYNSVSAINTYFRNMETIFDKIFNPSKKNNTVKGGRKKKYNKTKKGGYTPILMQENMFAKFINVTGNVPILGLPSIVIFIATTLFIEPLARFAFLIGVRLPTKPFRMAFNALKLKYDNAKYNREQKRLEEQARREEEEAEKRRLELIEKERREMSIYRRRLLDEDLPENQNRIGLPDYKPFASSPRSVKRVNSAEFPPPAPRSSERSLPPGYYEVSESGSDRSLSNSGRSS